MKSFSIFLVLFIFCHADKIGARSVESRIDKWLNTKIEDLNEQCELDEKTVLDREALGKYYNEIQEYMVKEDHKDLNPKDYFFNVTYNPDMLRTLKKVINNIQTCLDEDERLNPKELAHIINKVLTMHANRVLKIAPTVEEDVTSCETFSNPKLEQCAKPYKHLLRNNPSYSNGQLTILQILVPALTVSSSCTEVLPLEQCFMKYMSDCNSNARKYFQIILTPSEISDGICENFLENSDFDSDESINDISHHQDDDEANHSLKRLFHL